MKKIIFLFLLIAIPVFVFGQSTGKIMSNRSSSYTLSVDTVNCNSKINFLQTTASITITIPNRTTSALCGSNISSGVTMYLSNIGSTSTTLSVSGSSSFTLAVNGLAILNWVGTKWTIVYVSPSGLGTFVKLAGDSMTGNLDMKSHEITNASKINNTVSGDNIWFTPSSGLSINSFSALSLNSLNTTTLSGTQIDLTPVNSLRIATNSGSSFVTLSTTALSSSRSVNFPNKSGTFAYISDLTGYMPIAAPNDTGIHSSASGPVGEYIPHRTTSVHGPPWNNLRTYSIGGGSYANPSAWTQVTQDPSNTYIQSQTGSNSSNLIVGSGTPTITLQSIGSGASVGIASTNSGFYSRLRTTNFTSDRFFEFPDSSGTIALLSNIPTVPTITASNGLTKTGNNIALGGSLTTSTAIDIASNRLQIVNGSNNVFDSFTGAFYDAATNNVSVNYNSHTLNLPTTGFTALNWASPTNGLQITNFGSVNSIFLKNTNITSPGRTFEFPNITGTLLTDNSTATLTNKTISGSSNTISNIANASLTNSTISGISLGSNLASLTLGTYLSGSSYNGSGAVTVNVSTMTSTVGGAVPTPPNNTTTFLRGDGTFATPAGGGTVTAVSVASANGFAGSSSGGTTPALTISTTVTGIIKGNGTGMSVATPGTDYAIPATIAADGTDADYTAVVNSVKYLPSATLTTNRTITIPTGSNGDFLEIYNNEGGFSWLLTGSSIYLSDGVTTISSLYANTNHLIRKVSGKWRILN